MMPRLSVIPLLTIVLSLPLATDAYAQREGQSTTIRTGTVTAVQSVDLKSGTNIRRAPDSACEPESLELMRDEDVEAVLQQDASSCFAARQELADAEDDATFERAVRKVKLLCYD